MSVVDGFTAPFVMGCKRLNVVTSHSCEIMLLILLRTIIFPYHILCQCNCEQLIKMLCSGLLISLRRASSKNAKKNVTHIDFCTLLRKNVLFEAIPNDKGD